MGRRGSGTVKKGILGLTSEQTQLLNDAMPKDQANELKKIIDANLPAGLKAKVDDIPQLPGSNLRVLKLPVPMVERVAERTSKAFLRKGGYVVKKKRKKGYSVKR